MFNQTIFSKQNIFNIIALLIAYFLFGYLGLLTILFSYLISILPFGRDIIYSTKSKKNHGINKDNNSRLGGFLIFSIFVFCYFNFIPKGVETKLVYVNIFYFLIVLVALIGVVDDILNNIISSKIKLFSQTIIIIFIFLINQNLIFQINSVEILSSFPNVFLINLFLSTIFCLAFMNASNMSDGANGLLSGIAILSSFILYKETNNEIFLYLTQIIGGFFVVNTVYGKIYLGDTGSYLIGVYLCLIGFYFTQNLNYSLGFFACILSYPCLEFLQTVARRIKNKKNILIYDDYHLHNLLFRNLDLAKINSHYKNSFIGIIINFIFTLPGLLIYLYIGNTYSYIYWIIFLIQSFLYLYLYLYLKKKDLIKNK